ncbi:MAG: hypothetical protein EBS84_22240 [Proteobacteria bacterium]|jgi:hypothetical protein|nr:hypothetical protein [Pseudomonadota bacterium]
MKSLGKKLKEFGQQNGIAKTKQFFSESISKGDIAVNRISLRGLAEGIIGDDWAEQLNRFNGPERTFMEATEAVDASNFAAITGQILITTVHEKYKLASFIGDQLVTSVPAGQNLASEIIPWLSDISPSPEVVQPGMPYPQTQFSGNYVRLPAIEKVGRICAITAEMIYSDKTSQALASAESVGTYCGLVREERILNTVLGLTGNYVYGTAAGAEATLNTYSATAQSGMTYGFINKVTSYSLSNFASINTLEQLFYQMKDPNTGKPIDIFGPGMQMLVMPFQKYTASRILNPQTVTKNGPYATSGDVEQLESPNPLDQNYGLLTSAHARNLLVTSGISASTADKYVYLGNFKKAFVWREAKPMEVVQAPANNWAEFNQDIAVAIKASWWGSAGVMDPRYVVQGLPA